MAGFFGRRNAWANGPPPGGGEGGGGGGPVQGNRNVLGVGAGSAMSFSIDPHCACIVYLHHQILSYNLSQT